MFTLLTNFVFVQQTKFNIFYDPAIMCVLLVIDLNVSVYSVIGLSARLP